MGMLLVKCGEQAPPALSASFNLDAELEPARGETIVWHGALSVCTVGWSKEGKQPSEGISVDSKVQPVRVAITDQHLHFWANNLGGNPFNQTNSSWVVAGVLGMAAENLLKKRALKGHVMAGRLTYSELVWTELIPQGQYETVRFVRLPSDAPNAAFEVTDWTLSTAGAQWIAETATKCAAQRRLVQLGALRADYPYEFSLIEQQATSPTASASGRYMIPLFTCGDTPLPRQVKWDRADAVLAEEGRREMAEVERQVALQEHGVRSNDPNAPRFTLDGYSLVLPRWWDSVIAPTPPSGSRHMGNTINWTREHFGVHAGGPDHWREVMKLWINGIDWDIPPVISSCYAAGGLEGQAALQMADVAEAARRAVRGQVYFPTARGTNGSASLQAGLHFRNLGKLEAARMWLRRSARIGGASGAAANKELHELNSSSR